MNIHGKEIKIFTANATPEVAGEIAKHLGVPLGKSEVKKFSDGEIAVSINESVRGSDVFVVQSTCAPVNTNLMELLIMIDAFKRASAASITAVMPYFGYARQDRKAKARDPISAKLVADLGVPILSPYFAEKFKGHDPDEIVVASPDLGSVGRARKFAERIDARLAIVDKRRPKANVSEVMNIIGDVQGKKVIIVDDLIDTAGTLCNAAEAMIVKGGATEVYACATHGVLSGPALERLEKSPIKELVLLDTIPLPKEANMNRITQLHVASVFAEAIGRIYEDKPVSPLFG